MSQQETQTATDVAENRGYANYVLAILVLVYVFNFIDRQILSILAEEIKADLGLSDADIGFLYGTAFAVFYAVFGIPLSRLADVWNRRKLISIGLFFWSFMTALSGTARSFASLATYRIGVGIGESSASPAAFSMLGDYFPAKLRATAVAIYSSGVYIGSGLGIMIGGLIVDNWNEAFKDGGAPFGLVGWQAAFFAVGVPGLLMAIWVWTIKEPVRGASEGIVQKGELPPPLEVLGKETAAVIPPFTLFSLQRHGGGRAVGINLAIAAVCAAAAWGMISWLGSPAQWIALAIGLYCFFSWTQGLARRDAPAFQMIYRSPAVVFGMVGFAWLGFVGYGVGFWGPPFFIRAHGLTTAETGTILGISAAVAGWIGVTSGGVVSDWLKQRSPRARHHCGMICAGFSLPLGYVLVTTPNLMLAYVINFFFQLFSSFWIGSAVALANELVLPRMRATSSAFYILSVTFIGLALGPYTIGQISTRLGAAGADPADSLRQGILIGLGAYVLGVIFLWLSGRTVEQEEKTRLDRARAAGEAV